MNLELIINSNIFPMNDLPINEYASPINNSLFSLNEEYQRKAIKKLLPYFKDVSFAIDVGYGTNKYICEELALNNINAYAIDLIKNIKEIEDKNKINDRIPVFEKEENNVKYYIGNFLI